MKHTVASSFFCPACFAERNRDVEKQLRPATEGMRLYTSRGQSKM